MSAVESIQCLIELLTEANADAVKHDRGVDAAGARLRKKLQSAVNCYLNAGGTRESFENWFANHRKGFVDMD